jgi:hypothetical protein
MSFTSSDIEKQEARVLGTKRRRTEGQAGRTGAGEMLFTATADGLVACATVRNENAEKERRGEERRGGVRRAKEKRKREELPHHFSLV